MPATSVTMAARAAGCSTTPRRPAPARSATRPSGTAAASASAAARASSGSCSPTTTMTGAVTAPRPCGAVPGGERLEVADRGSGVGLHPLPERPLVDLAWRVGGVAGGVELAAGPARGHQAHLLDGGRIGRRRGRRSAADAPPPPASRATWRPPRGRLAAPMPSPSSTGDVDSEPVGERLRCGRPWRRSHRGCRARRSGRGPGRSKAIGRWPSARASSTAGEDVAVAGDVVDAQHRRPPVAAGGSAGQRGRAAVVDHRRQRADGEVLRGHWANVPKRRAPRPTVVGAGQASTSS